jgi:uncharacterized protein (TIGR02246 family)
MTDSTSNAADVVRAAMSAVENGDRDGWLGLFAEDAHLEDPVGQPPRDGRDEIAAFWDAGIAALEAVRFDVRKLHEVPEKVVVLADIAVTAPGGASASYDAVLHYVVDETGAIRSLRAFWDPQSVMAQLAGSSQ